MATLASGPSSSKAALWTGWIIGVLPVLLFVMSASMKFLKPPEFSEGNAKLGWDESAANILGVVELASALLYLYPRTAVLGAVLLTGYLGGAIATHVRVHDAFIIPVIMGIALWAGLWLRDLRIRSLLPLRS